VTLVRTGGLLLVMILVVACSAGSTASPALTAAGASQAPGTVTVVITTAFGPILTGPTGHALYVHQGDSATTSTCTGGCLQAWPAFTVAAGGVVTPGPNARGTFATFVRADDGTTQVTYQGMPLYYWTGDSKAGDVTGHGVNGFAVASVPGFQPAVTPAH